MAMGEHGPALGAVGVIDQDPISPDFVRLQSERAVVALEALLADLPEDPSGLSGPGADEYAAFRQALVDWRDYSAQLLAEVDTDYDDLVALAASWDQNSAPPQVFVEAIDGHMLTWIPTVEQACAAFAVAADVTPGCLFGQQGGASDVEAADPQTVSFGGAVVRIDPTFPVSDIATTEGFVLFDYGPGFGTFALSDPPVVADPAAADADLEATIPWPNDVDAWLAELPLEVVSSTDWELESSTWRVWHVRADEQVAIIANAVGPAWTLGHTEIHLFQTTLGDSPVVGVLEIAPNDLDRTDDALDDIATVLSRVEVS